MQEKQQGLVNPYSRASEIRDYDLEAQSFLFENTNNDSQLGLDCSRISQQSRLEQRIIESYQDQISRLKQELESVSQQNQQKLRGIQLSSPSKSIQLVKIGTTVSYVMDRVIKDEDIDTIFETKDNFIFLLRSRESLKIDKSAIYDAVLSQEVGRQMGYAPPLIEQVGAPLFQGKNQISSVDECCQFDSPFKKVKKELKEIDKLEGSNQKNSRGGRGQRKKN